MARRRKGRDISGWVIVDKPAGWGSTDVVNKLRWAFQAKKAGHAGTLDPAATGLLAVALGEATKVIPYVTDAMKAYDFTLRWGQATSTDDAEGEVVAQSDARPDEAAIRAALPGFEGWIRQVPPAFSAVKVEGERAYDLAREGATVELEARDLFVDSLTLTEVVDADTARLELVCGKGGYVRAIARDLGRALDSCAHVTALRRIWSGPFDLEGAVQMEQIEALAQTDEIDSLLRPLEDGLAELPRVTLSADGAQRLMNGNPGRAVASDADYGEVAWGAYRGRALAIGTYRAGELHPIRVFPGALA
jgi:tRNA pseudouridine55 synthase